MPESLILDKVKLAIALSEVDGIRQKLPDTAISDLAQEVVKRVASNLRTDPPFEFSPSSEQIDALCRALLSSDGSAAIAMIEQAQRRGATYDSICQVHLAVAAQRLGEWWSADQVSFYKVTIAAGRIYAILRILRLQRQRPTPDGRRWAVFASVPGDSHTLGITIAADMARDKGWDIELLMGRSHDELVLELEKSDATLIGLSASSKQSLPALLKLIVALRLGKPKARIMICGKIADLNLGLDGVTGADAVTSDFDTAIAYMEQTIS